MKEYKYKTTQLMIITAHMNVCGPINKSHAKGYGIKNLSAAIHYVNKIGYDLVKTDEGYDYIDADDLFDEGERQGGVVGEYTKGEVVA